MIFDFEFLADRPEAVPLVARWWFEAWGHFWPESSVEAYVALINEELSRDVLPIRMLAVADDAVLGVAELKLHELVSLYPEKKFWLGSVFVAPEFRGRGVGSALARKIAELAASKDIPALHLQTEDLTGGLYAKVGWEPIEQVHSKGRDVLVMVKRLK